jgi:homocysteine S-methyltransferase
VTAPEAPTLAETIAARPVALDGGLATRLEARGNDLSSALWSARLLVDDPDEIVGAHRDFFASGAEVATTASYQASFDGFAALGFDAGATAGLLRRSVELARRARDESGDGRVRWVAASVGPYGAALADGSEYRGDYRLSVADLRRWHRPRLAVLAGAGADVLALETIPCAAEAEALLAEIDGSGVPAWLSLTCAGGRTRAGESVDAVFAMAADVPEVIAVGVNCCAAAEVRSLLGRAVAASGKPGIAYPNSGEAWNAAARCWTGPATFDAGLVDGWIEAGGRLVGGCCRVTPEAIAGIAGRLSARCEPAPHRG